MFAFVSFYLTIISKKASLLPIGHFFQGWSPVQEVLPTVYKIHSYRLILMGNRPEGLMLIAEEQQQSNFFQTAKYD
jgi:hypothetical protein